MVGLRGFGRVIISPDALEENEGQRIAARCRDAGMEVEVRPEASCLAMEPLNALLVRFAPPDGWISKAEHGILSTRPNEYYLHPIEGCRSACSYCYLRGQFGGLRPLRLYVGVQALLSEIDEVLACGDSAEYLFCTGERADSLAEIDIYPVACLLVEHFSRKQNGRLELRTKSGSVQPLLALDHRGRTTVSFSIAPAGHVQQFEHGTATLAERLAAARECQAAGYAIAFNLEPLILIEGWQEAYLSLLEAVAATVDRDRIDHVSVGCLRFGAPLEQTSAFRQTFDDLLMTREYVEYRPGKMNGTYPRDERIAAYRYIATLLNERHIHAPIHWSLEEPALLPSIKVSE